MAKKSTFTASYEALPKIVKLILQFFFGWAIGGIYRILRFVENSNMQNLIVGILALIPGIDAAFWIVDFITELLNDRITLLVA